MSKSVSQCSSLNPEEKKPPSEVLSPLNATKTTIQYGSTSDATALLKPDYTDESRGTKLCNLLVTMTIEPIMFCYMFGFIMNVSILTNFMMDIGCRQNFNYSSEICNNLTAYGVEKKKVEILATDYSLYFNLLSLIGAFFMIFIAPWSDKYGRKLPLLCAIIGSLMSDLIFILCSVYDAGLVYLLVAKLPSEIFGGFICVLTVIYSMASEVSTEKNRTLKYTFIELAMGSGISLGALTGGLLQRYYGYFYIFLTMGCLHAFCFIWMFLAVEETTGKDSTATFSEKARDFFNCRSLKDGIQATFREREGSKRILVVLLLLSMCVVVLTFESFGSIGFVFVHYHYSWDISTYTVLQSSVSIATLVTNIVMIPMFIRVFKLSDFTLGIIGTISMMSKNFFIAFATNGKTIFYIGQASGILGNLSTLAIRSVLSKMINKDELGKVFSFLATCEAVLPMAGTIALTKVFEATMDSFPNVAYVMTVFLLILPVLTFIWAFISFRKYSVPAVSAQDPVRENDQLTEN